MLNAIALGLEAIAGRLEAIAGRFKAIAGWLEAIAISNSNEYCVLIVGALSVTRTSQSLRERWRDLVEDEALDHWPGPLTENGLSIQVYIYVR